MVADNPEAIEIIASGGKKKLICSTPLGHTSAVLIDYG